MIVLFRHKRLQRFFESGNHSGINPNQVKKLKLILTMLDAANSPADLNFPGSFTLKGEWDGSWSIRVSGNWRIVFKFESGEVRDVDYLDYH